MNPQAAIFGTRTTCPQRQPLCEAEAAKKPLVHASPASEYSTASSSTRTLPRDNESSMHVCPNCPVVLRMSAAIPTKPSRNSQIRSRGHGCQATNSVWQQKKTQRESLPQRKRGNNVEEVRSFTTRGRCGEICVCFIKNHSGHHKLVRVDNQSLFQQ